MVVRRAVAVFGLWLTCFLGPVCVLDVSPAEAQQAERTYKGWELRSGFLAHDYGLTTNSIPDGEGDFSIHGQLLFPSPGLFRYLGAPRPHLGTNIAVDGTSQLFAGLTWDVRFARETPVLKNLFLILDGGAAVHNGENLSRPTNPVDDDFGEARRFLGCRAQFRFGTGLGYDINERVSAQIYTDHISTLGLCDPDDGLENIGMRLGYKF
ncbi:MAG: acyloxyacyl hydrolase [Alphaproteobacteria bacterium]